MSVTEKRELKEKIIAKAQQLGFTLVGVTTPDKLTHYDLYLDWLRHGYYAEMGYMAREDNVKKRAAPSLVFPPCQSVLVLGAPYSARLMKQEHNGENNPLMKMNRQKEDELYGQVAAYAWGDDYHTVLVERMKLLVDFIEQEWRAPVSSRYYTDTGPLLERELAQRAGLGWIGKNSCLINPDGGSYYLLAEILLDIDLPPDKPFPYDRCGSCTKCIETCPTDAILSNRTVDSNRCISYLTIELKGGMPKGIRPMIGSWVFGCDVCQQVCPWNQKLVDIANKDLFHTRPQIPFPYLLDELALTPQEFNRKFKNNPVKRTKRRGYLRNVSVALGNGGDSRAVPALVKALEDDEPLVRGHAAWALGKIRGTDAEHALALALMTEKEPYVVNEIKAALSNFD